MVPLCRFRTIRAAVRDGSLANPSNSGWAGPAYAENFSIPGRSRPRCLNFCVTVHRSSPRRPIGTSGRVGYRFAALPEASRSNRQDLLTCNQGIRSSSKLLHEPGDVSVRPVFDESTIFDTVHRDPADLDCPSSWLVPNALAQKGPTCSYAGHYLVAFGDDVVNEMRRVGEGCLEDSHVLSHPFATWRQVRKRRIVVHVLLSDQLFDNVQITAIQFSEPAQNDRFALLAGHVPIPSATYVVCQDRSSPVHLVEVASRHANQA